ncbi:MAG: MBL fold metallo-hydrolase [Thermoleophilia bacterium]
MRITWTGHATVVIESDGTRVVTDPVLAGRVAHLRRVAAPGAGVPGRPAAVLLSHLHRDHLDMATMRTMDPSVPVLAPAGSRSLLARAGRRDVREMRPGDTATAGALTVTATLALHDGGRPGRGPVAWRHRPVTALGFVIAGSATAYFAGDTGLFPGMADLAGSIDVAVLPVGGWHPRLGPGHLDAEDAARALALLRPRVAIPVHWGTYAPPGMRRGHPHLRDQGERFRAAARRHAPRVRVVVLAPGERFTLEDADG